MIVATVLAVITDAFMGALAEQVTQELWGKLLKGNVAKNAFQQALGAAIQHYAMTGSRLSLAQPLLQKDSLLAEPTVAQELAKVVKFGDEPNIKLIGERWKVAFREPPPLWRNFTNEARFLIDYLQAELHNTDVFRPVFETQSLESIATNVTISAQTLSDIETHLAALTDLMAARFGELTLAFANSSIDIQKQIRDYSNLIEEKTRDFVGRKFVFDSIVQFTKDNLRGYYFVRGDPGIGKTALASQLVRTHGYVHHFNIQAEGINKAETFLKNVCSQLIAIYGLNYDTLPPNATQDSGFLSKLLSEISSKLESGSKTVIIIDALDEVDNLGLAFGTNTLYLPITLPPHIYIVATTRKLPLQLRIECEQGTLDIEQDSDGNIADIHEYVAKKATTPGLQAYITKQTIDSTLFIQHLIEKSQGNFIYLYYVLTEIERGLYKDLKLDAIPIGLQNYYQDHWRRIQDQDKEAWFNYKLPIIMALTVVKEPVSMDLLANFSGIQQRSRIRSVLKEWSQFLYEQMVDYEGDSQKRYRIYHASFHDFIADKEEVKDELVSRQEAHRKIADVLWDDLFSTQ